MNMTNERIHFKIDIAFIGFSLQTWKRFNITYLYGRKKIT